MKEIIIGTVAWAFVMFVLPFWKLFSLFGLPLALISAFFVWLISIGFVSRIFKGVKK